MKRIEVNGGYLVHGDCLKVMRKMKPRSVDLVIGSPPYEDARLYLENGKDLGIALDTEAWVTWMCEVVEASLRICKGLVAFVVGHGKRGRRWSGGPALLCADLIRKGVCLRSPCWYERNGIMGSGGRDWLRSDIEWIVCATNDDNELSWSDNTACGLPPKFQSGGRISHYGKDGKRVNSIRPKAPTSDGRKPNGRKRGISPKLKIGYDVPEKANPGNVIRCGAVGGGHMGSNIAHDNEAAFPTKVPLFFIKSFCKPGGWVMDPFGGSGTTIQAAIETGRRFIACDLRMSQIELMKRRVRQAHRKKGFFQQ